MDFEPYFKVHNLVSVDLKSIILGPMTNLNMIFHVVVSVYRLVKTLNSPYCSSLLNFGTANLPFIVCQVVTYRGLKTKYDFQLVALKVAAVAYERWPFTGGSKRM